MPKNAKIPSPAVQPFAKLIERLAQDIQTGRIKGLFVTGTDTDVGKTYISATLLKALKQQLPHHHITARKPIASGCTQCDQNDEIVCEDALQLCQALDGETPLKLLNPYRFIPAVAPTLALQQAGRNITTQDLAQACQSKADFTLIEGAGGFLSPISRDGLNKDLAQALGYPILLVVKDQLGCVNHTLLTQSAIQAANLPLYATLLNFYAPQNKNAELMIQFGVDRLFTAEEV